MTCASGSLSGYRRWGRRLSQRVPILPGCPSSRIAPDGGFMLLQYGEIVNRVNPIDPTAHDKAHQATAVLGAIPGLEELTVFAIHDHGF